MNSVVCYAIYSMVESEFCGSYRQFVINCHSSARGSVLLNCFAVYVYGEDPVNTRVPDSLVKRTIMKNKFTQLD